MSPKVDLRWEMWCASHLEPLREHWPAGAAAAMMGLFNAAVRDARIIRRCGGGVTVKGDVRLLNQALAELSPVCCLLGDEIMHMVIGYAKEGQIFNGTDGPMEPNS
jgi:hypothetical protein